MVKLGKKRSDNEWISKESLGKEGMITLPNLTVPMVLTSSSTNAEDAPPMDRVGGGGGRQGCV